MSVSIDELVRRKQEEISTALAKEAKDIEAQIKKLKDILTVAVDVKGAAVKPVKIQVPEQIAWGIQYVWKDIKAWEKWEYIQVSLRTDLEWTNLGGGASPYAVEKTLRILRRHKFIDAVIGPGQDNFIKIGAYRSEQIALY